MEKGPSLFSLVLLRGTSKVCREKSDIFFYPQNLHPCLCAEGKSTLLISGQNTLVLIAEVLTMTRRVHSFFLSFYFFVGFKIATIEIENH